MYRPTILTSLILAIPLVLAQNTTSNKRGLVYIPNAKYPQDNGIWVASGSDLNWYYNYGPSPNPNYDNTGLEFVPMLFGAPASDTDTTFSDTVTGLISSGMKITHILSYNEPDASTGGGSGVPADTAAATWIRELEPLRTKYNISLGAPAVTAAPTGFNWLQNFFTACAGQCNADFIGVHYYGDFQGLASHVGQVRATYLNMTIWVTEWADPGADLADSQTFYNQSSQLMDRTDYVDRYSYFGSFRSSVSNVGPNAAMLDQNGQLTSIGSWYLGGAETNNIPKGAAGKTQAFAGWTVVVGMLALWLA